MEENKNIDESSNAAGDKLNEEETISIPKDPVAPTANIAPPTLHLQPSDMEVHHHTHPVGR